MAADETIREEASQPRDPEPEPAQATRPAAAADAAPKPADQNAGRPPLSEQRSAWPEWRRFPPMSRPLY